MKRDLTHIIRDLQAAHNALTSARHFAARVDNAMLLCRRIESGLADVHFALELLAAKQTRDDESG